jgi:hypothetical protein
MSATGASGRLPAVMRHGVVPEGPQQAESLSVLLLIVAVGLPPVSVQQQQAPSQSMEAETTARTGLANNATTNVRQKSRIMIIGRLWSRMGLMTANIK